MNIIVKKQLRESDRIEMSGLMFSLRTLADASIGFRNCLKFIFEQYPKLVRQSQRILVAGDYRQEPPPNKPEISYLMGFRIRFVPSDTASRHIGIVLTTGVLNRVLVAEYNAYRASFVVNSMGILALEWAKMQVGEPSLLVKSSRWWVYGDRETVFIPDASGQLTRLDSSITAEDEALMGF